MPIYPLQEPGLPNHQPRVIYLIICSKPTPRKEGHSLQCSGLRRLRRRSLLLRRDLPPAIAKVTSNRRAVFSSAPKTRRSFKRSMVSTSSANLLCSEGICSQASPARCRKGHTGELTPACLPHSWLIGGIRVGESTNHQLGLFCSGSLNKGFVVYNKLYSLPNPKYIGPTRTWVTSPHTQGVTSLYFTSLPWPPSCLP